MTITNLLINGINYSMIKVFQVITSVSLGGAENVAFNIIEIVSKLHPGKFDFTILEVYSSNTVYAIEKKAELSRKNIRIVTLGPAGKRLSLLFAPLRLWQEIRSEKPAIVHSHTDLPDLVLGCVLRFFRPKSMRTIRTIHNTEIWPTHYYLGRFVESSFIEDEIVGVSKAAISSYHEKRRKYDLQISHSSVIYNGCEAFEKSEAYFGLDRKFINIAFCGRFVSQKGVDILIDHLKRSDEIVKKKIRFHFIGDGTYKKELLQLKSENENIFLYGTVTNVSSKISEFDYFIMPSRFEGLPLVAIESSLAKVPVIAARVPGLEETLPPDWPRFFDLYDNNSLQGILRAIVNEGPNERASLGARAYEYAVRKFSLNDMGRKYQALYCKTNLKVTE